jgi:hypothetical protein
MPRTQRAPRALARVAVLVVLPAALASCHVSHSVYVADRISPERIHAGARSYFSREGLAETSWNADDLSGEYASEKPPRRLRLLIRPLGDGWNLDLRCYDAAGELDKRETGRLRDRLLLALRDEGLPAREGPF